MDVSKWASRARWMTMKMLDEVVFAVRPCTQSRCSGAGWPAAREVCRSSCLQDSCGTMPCSGSSPLHLLGAADGSLCTLTRRISMQCRGFPIAFFSGDRASGRLKHGGAAHLGRHIRICGSTAECVAEHAWSSFFLALRRRSTPGFGSRHWQPGDVILWLS